MCFSIQAGTFSLNRVTGLFSSICADVCLQLCSTTWLCSCHACLVCCRLAHVLELLHACVARWLVAFLAIVLWLRSSMQAGGTYFGRCAVLRLFDRGRGIYI